MAQPLLGVRQQSVAQIKKAGEHTVTLSQTRSLARTHKLTHGVSRVGGGSQLLGASMRIGRGKFFLVQVSLCLDGTPSA